ATRGFESYYSIYSDAKAWIAGGYIDYICPQIYWAFGTTVAPFDVLVRWWSALVDGTGVDLYIGHAAYKVPTDFKSETELPRQVEYARAYMGVSGSVFYGYADIAANSYKLKDNLAKLFSSPLKIAKPAASGAGVSFGRPRNGSTVADSAINVMGGSDPAYPVYYGGEKLARTKQGFFTVYVPLKDGKNEIVFTQNNADYTNTITKGRSAAAAPSPRIYAQLDSYKIEVIRPTSDITTTPGDAISISVQAPSKSTVTAKLGAISLKLEPQTNPPDEGTYMTETYSGTLVLPATQPKGEPIELGEITFSATRGNESATAKGISVKLINQSAYRPCEVVKDYSHLKISTTSEFYDDYLPASVGMRDNVIGFSNGYYKLGFGGWISAENVVLLPDKNLLVNRILSAGIENMGDYTELRFAVTENVPLNAKCKDGVFTVTLFNTPDGAPSLKMADNPMLASVQRYFDRAKKSAIYSFDLKHPDNWYGFDVVYEGGFIVIKIKNPMQKIEKAKPLEGLTIIVDAGHGGDDPGALGYLVDKNEKDLNLAIALATKTKLALLGAEVIMLRETDETVDIYKRMDMYNEINPDLLISVHHNSLGDAQDNTRVRGVLGLYCNDSGRLLAKSTSSAIADKLNRYEREARYQALAMLRSHRFPAALFEMSFMTNPDEYEFSTSQRGIELSAEAIADGVLKWIDDQQKWVK
ncbi:MAG: N-acetylmuramoyl-L-alanine amidase, partial [Oscillospiraceae bacterium]|nr:N-acetylmuramoyl-L-alanine amidase [Oscillospiraceae bacterium]